MPVRSFSAWLTGEDQAMMLRVESSCCCRESASKDCFGHMPEVQPGSWWHRFLRNLLLTLKLWLQYSRQSWKSNGLAMCLHCWRCSTLLQWCISQECVRVLRSFCFAKIKKWQENTDKTNPSNKNILTGVPLTFTERHKCGKASAPCSNHMSPLSSLCAVQFGPMSYVTWCII